MNKNLTEIILIVDRSDSMYSMKSDADFGINDLIEKQRKEDGDCNVTLVEFDNEYSLVEDCTPIQDVKQYSMEPRGMTALLDAVGTTIDTVGNRLSKTPENERPGLISVVIITDGAENCSKEYSLEQIKQKITTQQNTYKWMFTFLGANQDSFRTADSYGISASGVSNYNNYKAAIISTSSKLGRMRTSLNTRGLVTEEDNTFNSNEITAMNTKQV